MPEPDRAAIEGLAAELEGLVERIDDLALETLRQAAEQGASERPRLERDLTRARHALERALGILSRYGSDGRDEPI